MTDTNTNVQEEKKDTVTPVANAAGAVSGEENTDASTEVKAEEKKVE